MQIPKVTLYLAGQSLERKKSKEEKTPKLNFILSFSYAKGYGERKIKVVAEPIHGKEFSRFFIKRKLYKYYATSVLFFKNDE